MQKIHFQYRVAASVLVLVVFSCGPNSEIQNRRSFDPDGTSSVQKKATSGDQVSKDSSNSSEQIDATASRGNATATAENATTIAGKNVADVPDPLPDPVISLPDDVQVIRGAPVSLKAVALAGSNATFIWKKDDVALPAQTTAELKILAAAVADIGLYSVTILVDSKAVASKKMRLSVVNIARDTVKPIIDLQPTDQSVVLGGTAAFSVQARGNPQPTYQWRMDGVDIAGATERLFVIPKISAGNQGIYSVKIANTIGEIVSAPAKLVANGRQVLPKISSITPDQTVNASEQVLVKADVVGTHLKFKWFLNGVLIEGADRSTLKIDYATGKTAGEVMVEASNVLGKISAKTKLTVTDDGAGAICGNGWCTKMESMVAAYQNGDIGYKIKGWACKVGSPTAISIKSFGIGAVTGGILRSSAKLGDSDKVRPGLSTVCGLVAGTDVVAGFDVFMFNAAIAQMTVFGATGEAISNPQGQIGPTEAFVFDNNVPFTPPRLSFKNFPPFTGAVLAP
jgi:hypothetical protein